MVLCCQIQLLCTGEVDKKWVFQDQKDLNFWVTTSDRDHSEGSSECQLSINKAGRGLFSGTLCTNIPKDGKQRRAGYCNMRSTHARVSPRALYFN